MMADGNDTGEEVKVEEEGYLGEDKRDQSFVLLLRVTQANGKPLPIGGFTGRAMAQMLYEIAGVTLREAVILTDQEVVIEFEMERPIMEVSRAVHGLYQWAGQSISVDSLVARRDSIKEIVREKEIIREKQKELEPEHCRMREDQHEYQQMIEILEKVSDQIKKVENICSGSIMVLEGEYYTPPMSQIKMNKPGKLSAHPNLPIFLGQEPVPSTEGLTDQWLFQVEGALAIHMEEAVRSAVIGSVRGAAQELLRVYRLWGRDECHIKTYKRTIWTRAFKSQTSEGIFPNGAEKKRVSTNLLGGWNNNLRD